MLDEIIDCSLYGKLDELRTLYNCIIISYVLKFVNILRYINNGDQGSTYNSKQLTIEEIDNAEKLWIRSLQAKWFLAEFAFLQSHSKKVLPMQVHLFGLFIDHWSTLVSVKG